jgi:hypothetical protein
LKVLHTVPRVTNIQLADYKITKKAGINDGILLLPHPATSRYFLLPFCRAAATTATAF